MKSALIGLLMMVVVVPTWVAAIEFESYVGYSALRYPLSTERTRNRDYLLFIHLPASYSTEADKAYPVLYLLDPYWDFGSVTGMLGTLEYDGIVPEMIVVGIGYPGENPDLETLRKIDYTPVKSRVDANTGDGEAFLGFIEEELIPFVESEFRVDDSFRGLGGASFGGLFALYALFEKPELFQGILSCSPAVSYEERWIMQREEAFYIGGREEMWPERPARSLPTRLFLSVGGLESEANWMYEVQAFDRLLVHRGYDGFSYQYKTFEGYRHGGVKYPSYSLGLPYLFEDYLEALER